MAHVVFQTSDGQRHRLEHGDQIGRSETAALALRDRRISVAHAQIALRPTGLALLALRGVVHRGGEPVNEAVLEEGQRFTLPDGTVLEVVDVEHATGAVAYDLTDQGGFASLRIAARFESVELRGGGLGRPLVLTGKGAMVLIELVRAGEPVHWYRIARRIWPLRKGQTAAEHKEALRARWYQATARLRRELEAAGLQRPLIEARAGTMVLAVLPGDVVLDESD